MLDKPKPYGSTQISISLLCFLHLFLSWWVEYDVRIKFCLIQRQDGYPRRVYPDKAEYPSNHEQRLIHGSLHAFLWWKRIGKTKNEREGSGKTKNFSSFFLVIERYSSRQHTKHVRLHSGLVQTLTKEPMTALDSPQSRPWFLHPRYPTAGLGQRITLPHFTFTDSPRAFLPEKKEELIRVYLK